ncbi:MAG TPA: hypothetical protein VKV17_01755 [Bryobacteraceae bacterium]|nr:hypothetical protein [Bryobacteraceae bacterium]
MKPSKPLPGTRALLSVAGVVATTRATKEWLAEKNAETEPIDPATRFDAADVHWKAVFLTGLGILLGVWVAVVVIYPLFHYLSHTRAGGVSPSHVLEYVPPVPPAPRNEAEPHRDLSGYLAQQNAALSSYGWVDRKKGIASIPIGRAMEIIAQRGIPPSQPGRQNYYPPSEGSRLAGFEGKVRPIPR